MKRAHDDRPAMMTPWQSAVAAGRSLAMVAQIALGRVAGVDAVTAVSRRRLEALVRFARRESPLYRELYRGVADEIQDPAVLPVTTKVAMMARFDDWVTDRGVTRANLEGFLADRTRVGDWFRGRYIVWKSSGTTGEPGIYVQDETSLGIYDALLGAHLASLPMVMRLATASMLGGSRAALISATGDHFASIASWERVCRGSPLIAARAYSVMDPLDALVAKLNAFQPAYLASYPTMLALLAEEKRAGRLGISPLLVWSGGEHLAQRKARGLRRAFACPVINEYGASESLSIGFGCSEDWLHVNADWVILEPVDRNYQPTRPGDTSASVLITNLANRVQPIIRYDLGDAARVHPGRCVCGNPLPAIRIEGRRDEVVVLRDNDRVARIPPIALTTVVEEVVDTLRFQIVQRAADYLAVRVSAPTAEQRRHVFTAVASALRRYLSSQGIARVRILLDDDPPLPDARTGKLREVIVERPGTHSAATAAGIEPPAVSKRTSSQPNAGCS